MNTNKHTYIYTRTYMNLKKTHEHIYTHTRSYVTLRYKCMRVNVYIYCACRLMMKNSFILYNRYLFYNMISFIVNGLNINHIEPTLNRDHFT